MQDVERAAREATAVLVCRSGKAAVVAVFSKVLVKTDQKRIITYIAGPKTLVILPYYGTSDEACE
jgi:hypothetical protein